MTISPGCWRVPDAKMFRFSHTIPVAFMQTYLHTYIHNAYIHMYLRPLHPQAIGDACLEAKRTALLFEEVDHCGPYIAIITLGLQICKQYLLWGLKYIDGTDFERFGPHDKDVILGRCSCSDPQRPSTRGRVEALLGWTLLEGPCYLCRYTRRITPWAAMGFAAGMGLPAFWVRERETKSLIWAPGT